jgi:hypothetical protein
MELGAILGKIIDNNTSLFLRYGVVSAVTTSPNRVSVKISGSATAITGVRYLASYSPTTSDVVVCLLSDNDLIVLGKLT